MGKIITLIKFVIESTKDFRELLEAIYHLVVLNEHLKLVEHCHNAWMSIDWSRVIEHLSTVWRVVDWSRVVEPSHNILMLIERFVS